MTDFMQMKYENPEMKHSEIASKLSYSTKTLQSTLRQKTAFTL